MPQTIDKIKPTFFPISEVDARVLEHAPHSEEALAVLSRVKMGSEAVHAVGIVIGGVEKNGVTVEKPSHYIDLGSDPGTRIRTEAEAIVEGSRFFNKTYDLPDVHEAHARMLAQPEGGETYNPSAFQEVKTQLIDTAQELERTTRHMEERAQAVNAYIATLEGLLDDPYADVTRDGQTSIFELRQFVQELQPFLNKLSFEVDNQLDGLYQRAQETLNEATSQTPPHEGSRESDIRSRFMSIEKVTSYDLEPLRNSAIEQVYYQFEALINAALANQVPINKEAIRQELETLRGLMVPLPETLNTVTRKLKTLSSKLEELNV